MRHLQKNCRISCRPSNRWGAWTILSPHFDYCKSSNLHEETGISVQIVEHSTICMVTFFEADMISSLGSTTGGRPTTLVEGILPGRCYMIQVIPKQSL
jgi:hypothetical protein